VTLRFPVAKFGTADQTFGVVVQVHVILSASLTGVRHCVWLGSDVGVVWKVENWKVERGAVIFLDARWGERERAMIQEKRRN
jgi:hypothetical protein